MPWICRTRSTIRLRRIPNREVRENPRFGSQPLVGKVVCDGSCGPIFAEVMVAVDPGLAVGEPQVLHQTV